MDPYDVVEIWLQRKGTETRRAYLGDLGHRDRAPLPDEPWPWLDFMGENAWHAVPQHVDAWLNQWPEAAPGSRRRRTSSVFSFYDTAVTLGACLSNPAAALSRKDYGERPEPLAPHVIQQLRSAADRWHGPTAERDRLICYLLMDDWRPGQITAQLIDAHHLAHEQGRVTAKQPQKGGGTRRIVLSSPVVPVLEDYLAVRIHRGPHSYPDTGPLITSIRGRALDARETPRAIVRRIAATDLLLAPLADSLTADLITHSPNPFKAAQDSYP